MIWLVGCTGMLGTDLGRAFDAAGLAWVGSDHRTDIGDPLALADFARTKPISWVVNAAAYTAVDRAEEEPSLACRVNTEGPAHLARWASEAKVPLVHFSTDYVFSGTGAEPYQEDDPVAPRGVYGQTKADGEAAIRTLCLQHYILRTSWLYGVSGANFVYTMLRLMSQKDSLGVVADQWGSPTWTVELARIVVELVRRDSHPWGTYHASGEGRCNWYQFALAIYEEALSRGLLEQRSVTVNPLTTAQYPTKALRPAWSVLSKNKLRNTFGLVFSDWKDSLKSFLDLPLETHRFRT